MPTMRYPVIFAMIAAAIANPVPVNHPEYVQVNLYTDSNCKDYSQSFHVTGPNTGYEYSWTVARSFVVANCNTYPFGEQCTVRVKGNDEHWYDRSIASDGSGGQCVPYDGSRDDTWVITIN